jgi:hypothetical protein
MTKTLHDDVFDAALNYIETNGDEIWLCSAAPTNYTEASSTYALGSDTPTFTGPANGDASGRKTQVDAVSGASVTGTGTATHIAICDSGNTKVLAVVSLASSQAVTSGNTFNLTAFDIEIADPT